MVRLAIFLLIAASTSSPCVAMGGSPIPTGAKQAISSVHAAATNHDLSALRALMADEFTWSFGGDSSPDQAIAAWRSDPSAIAALRRITGKSCGRISEQFIQCPQNAGVSYRAGFTETPAGWRMAYFVAGD